MTALWVALAVVLDGAAGFVGGLLPEAWLQRHRPEMLGFAAGALLSVSVLELVPESLAARGLGALPWLLGGILALALLEWLMSARGRDRAVSYAILGADALHNFGDGMAIAAAFITSTRLGVITSLAVIVHEVPEEVADYAILRKSNMPKREALLWLAGVQLTAGLGAVATFVGEQLVHANGVILALAAGTFIYIAAVELLPDVLHEPTWRSRIAGLVGLAVGVAVTVVLS